MLVLTTWGGLTKVFIVATFCITFERVYGEIYCEIIAIFCKKWNWTTLIYMIYISENIGYIWEPASKKCASHAVQIFATKFSNCLWLCGHHVLQTCQIFEGIFEDFFLPAVKASWFCGCHVLQIGQKVDKYFVPACRKHICYSWTKYLRFFSCLPWKPVGPLHLSHRLPPHLGVGHNCILKNIIENIDITSSPTSSALATMSLLVALEKELRKRWLVGAGNSFCTNMLHSRHLDSRMRTSEKSGQLSSNSIKSMTHILVQNI